MRPFVFDGIEYTDFPTLLNALGLHWEEGKKILFNGQLKDFFIIDDRSTGQRCVNAKTEFLQDPSNGNGIYLKWLCRSPGIPGLYWMGRNYGKISMLPSALSSTQNKDLCDVIIYMTKERFLADFVKNNGGNENMCKAAVHLQEVANRSNSKFNIRNIPAILSFVLKGETTFSLNGKQFTSTDELAIHMQQLASVGQQRLEKEVEKLYADESNLSPAFEAWLLVTGKGRELNEWRKTCQSGFNDSEEEITLPVNSSTPQSQAQDMQTFSDNVFDFEKQFSEALNQYPNVLETPNRFMALMNDLFPGKGLQTFLLSTLYRMDIVLAIQKADALDELFVSRFVNRIVKDCGVREEYAKWAASIWCTCYGEEVLKKTNSVKVYRVL